MNPSLLLIPDRYKASKLYSQIPDSGAGDLAFTRANDTATRVNSAGLIEKVRTNLILQSEDFANAAWTKYQTSATGNTTTAPNGTLTADTLTENTSNDIHVAFQSNTVVAGELTVSCYAKANTKSHAWLQIYDGSTFQSSGIFNLTAGTVSGAGTITNEGNGWYRLSFTATVVAGSTTSYIGLSNGTNVSYTGTSQSIFIWGYQAEQGVLTPYIPTTTAAVSVGPVANIPRIDYTGGGCGKLLLEPQRTNSVLFSEQFNNAAYTKNNLTVTANNLVSPDGYTNADTAFETAFDGFHDLLQSPSLTSGTTYTLSSFVKAAGRDYCYLFLSDGTTPAAVKFNLATGVVLGTALGSPVSSKIENYGNGWYRCSMVYTSAATATGTLAVSATNSPALSLSGYTGDITKGIAVYGAQLEAGSYPTSYIPTLGASVTRSADSASKTGISSLIGATEGTIYGEFTFTGISPQMHMFVSVAGSFANAVYVQTFSATGISMQVWNGVVNQVAINSSGLTAGQNVKFAAAYKANDFALYVNGVQVGTDTSGSVPSGLSQLEVGGYAEAGSPFNFNSSIQTAALYPVRLTNAELATLTSL